MEHDHFVRWVTFHTFDLEGFIHTDGKNVVLGDRCFVAVVDQDDRLVLKRWFHAVAFNTHDRCVGGIYAGAIQPGRAERKLVDGAFVICDPSFPCGEIDVIDVDLHELIVVWFQGHIEGTIVISADNVADVDPDYFAKLKESFELWFGNVSKIVSECFLFNINCQSRWRGNL